MRNPLTYLRLPPPERRWVPLEYGFTGRDVKNAPERRIPTKSYIQWLTFVAAFFVTFTMGALHFIAYCKSVRVELFFTVIEPDPANLFGAMLQQFSTNSAYLMLCLMLPFSLLYYVNVEEIEEMWQAMGKNFATSAPVGCLFCSCLIWVMFHSNYAYYYPIGQLYLAGGVLPFIIMVGLICFYNAMVTTLCVSVFTTVFTGLFSPRRDLE